MEQKGRDASPGLLCIPHSVRLAWSQLLAYFGAVRKNGHFTHERQLNTDLVRKKQQFTHGLGDII